MVELRAHNLAHRFGRRVLFRKLNLRVGAGECLLVTGPNGAGKSTLLQILAGLTRASAGSVELLAPQPISREQQRRVIGMVTPDLVLYNELTAHENLAFFAGIRGVAWRRERSLESLARMGLEARLDDPLKSFSSGMRVRMKYAVALQADPLLLLLDEPTAMLDQRGAALVEQVIADQRLRGVTVLATNDPREERHGDSRIHLDLAA